LAKARSRRKSLDGEQQTKLREKGDEYGATTGRPRRCGWYDGVAVRFAARVNSVDSWAVTKLDILSGMDSIKFCVEYTKTVIARYKHFPSDSRILSTVRPVYEELPGWSEVWIGVTRWEDFPAAKRKITSVTSRVSPEVPVSIVSVGASRESNNHVARSIKTSDVQVA
jgi:adenylosuccinate synthase